MVTKKKIGYDVPSPIIKEIQHMLSLVIVDKLIASNSMKLHEQYKFCFNEYHGSADGDDNLGQSELFLQGRLYYRDAFDEQLIDITDKNHTTGNKNRTLKTVLTQDADSLLSVGKHLTTNVMTQVSKKKADLLSGQQIKYAGELAKKNIMKATAFADAYCKNTEGGGGPSGHNIADLYVHVLDQMYSSQLSCGGTVTNEDENEACVDKEPILHSEEANGVSNNAEMTKAQTSTNKKRPDKWIFTSFMGFVLFSSYATTQDNTLEILKSTNYIKGGGRQEARSANKKEKDKKRSKEACHQSSPNKRGIIISDQTKIAALEQQEKKYDQ
ncbi:hypothetical protein ACA910_006623 [Epithemia clementina (nom. ined.)]